jgi:hypothetical protein
MFSGVWVSVTGQNFATQLDDSTLAGCPRIFQGKVSGARSLALPELVAAVGKGS